MHIYIILITILSDSGRVLSETENNHKIRSNMHESAPQNKCLETPDECVKFMIININNRNNFADVIQITG